MKNNSNSTCPICHAKTIKYVHSLESGKLIAIFIKFYLATQNSNKAINPSKIGLTINQLTNFQKLRYFGLVERTGDHGEWYLTSKGKDFINGCISIPVHAITYRGSVCGLDGPEVHINSYKESFGYDKPENYAREARSVAEVEQLSLV